MCTLLFLWLSNESNLGRKSFIWLELSRIQSVTEGSQGRNLGLGTMASFCFIKPRTV